MANQLRRLGTQKSSTSAISVPPAEGQKSFLIWFPAVAAVVVTVSVDVSAVVPLIETEVGLKLQIGLSFTVVIAVVTVQLRFTVPENPFVPTTLIVPVFPVVAPGSIVMEVVPPVPIVKPGTAETVSAMLVVALSEPEVPVMVTVTGVMAMVSVALSPWPTGSRLLEAASVKPEVVPEADPKY